MTKRLFGTDGIRGTANQYPMTPDMALRVATSVASVMPSVKRVVIGKDTRLSGYMIQPALTAGFVSMGIDVIQVGPMPTPAVAFLVRSLRADLGVMISASHNPYEDNGIKFFDAQGHKFTDETEHAIEQHVINTLDTHKANHDTLNRAAPSNLGRVTQLEDAPGRYIEYIKRTIDKDLRLTGLKIVVDCAHGAAYRLAPTILWELGADVVAIGHQPDGLNINQGFGVMHPHTLQAAVKEHAADLGVALDGDADRLVLCDHDGNLLNGDDILAILATHRHKSGQCAGVVGTPLSNLGFERYITDTLNSPFVRAQVGDRSVMAHMISHTIGLGGEGSGHVIIKDHATTGDGLLTALQILAIMVSQGQSLAQTRPSYAIYPQISGTVPLTDPNPLENESVQVALETLKDEFQQKTSGRFVIRPSGTEPVIRIMVEGPNAEQNQELYLKCQSLLS
jgi:phosphoglucosamine mutase